MWCQTALTAANDPMTRIEPSVSVRLDPFKLPHRFRYHTGLDGEAGEASVVIERETVSVCRRLPSGVPAALRLPMAAFEGVAVRNTVHLASDTPLMVIELLHQDPQLSIPLAVLDDDIDVVADWKAWSRVLGLPMIHVGGDGAVRPIEERLGRLPVRPTKPRRRRSVLAGRRPRFLVRRQPGSADRIVMVAVEREICGWE